MDFVEVIKVVSLVLFSSVKFLFAPFTVTASSYSLIETIAITITGGFAGVLFFFRFGGWALDRLTLLMYGDKPRKRITRKNRLIIWVKSKLGIVGLSLITPSLISIPLGALLAAKYFRSDKRTVPFLMLSVVFWSLVLSTFSHLVYPLLIPIISGL